MDGHLPQKAQRMQDSAAELGSVHTAAATAVSGGNLGLQPETDCSPYATYVGNCTNFLDNVAGPTVFYDESSHGFHNAGHGSHSTNIVYDNGGRYSSSSPAGASVAYSQGINVAPNAAYGFDNTTTDHKHRSLYAFNNFAGPSPAYGVGTTATHSSGAGAYPNSVNQHHYLPDAALVHGVDYDGANYATQNAAHGGLNPLGDLDAPSAAYGLGSYATRGAGIGSGRYPIDDIRATGAVYDQGNYAGGAPYAGNVDKGLYPVDNISAYNAVYDQGNCAGGAPCAGNVDNGFYHVDNISAYNTVYDQDNYPAVTPYADTIDHGLYPFNDIATPSALRHRCSNARYDPRTANIHPDFLPLDELAAPNITYDGANRGLRNAGFSPQLPGLTPFIHSTVSPPNTSGSEVDPHGRPRWACGSCGKTFGRPSDMQRHANKHSGVLPYQCSVAGCAYRGSYRRDKLEQHRRNCH